MSDIEKMFGKTYIVKVLDDGECITEGELIRCEDCKCWKPSMTDVTEHVCHWGSFRKNADDYCSWAERREE